MVRLIDVAPNGPIRIGVLYGTRLDVTAEGIRVHLEYANGARIFPQPQLWPPNIWVEIPYRPEPFA